MNMRAGLVVACLVHSAVAIAAPIVNAMPARQATASQIENALKLGGLKGAALDPLSVALSVAAPVAAKARLTFENFAVVAPHDNLGVMLFSADPHVVVDWDYVAGSPYLLDCEIQPNQTGIHAVTVSFDSTEHQNAEVTGGHIVFAVPGKSGSGSRHAYVFGAKGQTFFHGCTITRVVT